MKQISNCIIAVIITSTGFAACNKAVSDDDFVSYQNNALNDTSWSAVGNSALTINKLMLPDNTKNNIVDSFNNLIDNTLNYGDSLQIMFPANACNNSNGIPITSSGKVRIEITVLKKRGDFVKYATPTTNILSLLEAGTYCDIKLTKNGQDVTVNPSSQVQIKIKDSTANSYMQFFTGNAIKYNNDSIFSWAPSQYGQVSIWKDNTSNKVLGYQFNTSNIRWFGAAYYTDSSMALTRVNVTLPPNYTNKNTAVFAVFKAKKTITNFFSDASTKSFFTLNIPVNADATLVTVTKINDDYYLGNKAINITNANPINILPEKKTLPQILAFLAQL